ncbi:hypothetical protein BBJ28_00017154 [Nothophytophthora sp. Chile5]|nr:hypothetical protein BBJ28_00017154 [Nothophytophthora sp. Chile5]
MKNDGIPVYRALPGCRSRKGKRSRFKSREGKRHFVTLRLPCYHIMFGLLDVKQQSYLSPDVVQDRWNYADAVKLIPVLKETAKTNKRLQDLAWTATQTSATAMPGIATDVPSFRARARIRFTKLKKNEKVDDRLIVRIDVEKYNIAVAVFQPLVDDLVASSSIDFYQKLDVVSVSCSDLRRAMRDMKIIDDTEIDSDDMLDPLQTPSSSRSSDSGDSGTLTIIADSDDDVASTKESDSQRTIEKVPSSSDSSSSQETRAASVLHADDVTPGATLPQVAVDDATEGATLDRIVGDSGASVAEGATLGDVVVDSGASGPTTDVKAPDDVEEDTTQHRLSSLMLPSTIQSGSKNNVRRQNGTKPFKQTRLALQIDVSSWSEGVTLDDATEWLRRNTDCEMASKLLKREFYDCQKAHRAREKAHEWVKCDWDALESEAQHSLAVPDRTSSMVASDITNVLNVTSLTLYTSIVLLNKTTASVPTSEIIGVVPASEWLSDSPIVLMTQKLCAEHANAYCLSSLCSSAMSWEIPVDRDHNWAFVVAPCNASNVHWTLIVMDLKTSKVSIFDPMESENKMDGLPSFRGRLPAAATKILRLRLLWHLLCAPGVVVVNPTDRDWMEVKATELKLTKQLLDYAEEASS